MNLVSASWLPPLFAAGLLGEPVSVTHYLVVGAILFTAGIVCMAIKRTGGMPSAC